MAAVLVDTNVLVYAYDRGEAPKQARAIEVLAMLQVTGVGRLSTQALAEFFCAVTRGPVSRLTIAQAVEQTHWLSRSFRVLDVTPMIVLEALRGVLTRQLGYWDAQIWATARLHQVPIIFSEDFQTGRVLEGVRFVNPFASDFDIAEWA